MVVGGGTQCADGESSEGLIASEAPLQLACERVVPRLLLGPVGPAGAPFPPRSIDCAVSLKASDSTTYAHPSSPSFWPCKRREETSGGRVCGRQ